jgi:hypothetical protein
MRAIPSAVAAELAKDEVFPVTLLELGGPVTLRYTDVDRPVRWDGKLWQSRGFSYGKAKETLGLELAEFTVVPDNYDHALTAWVAGGNPTGAITTVYEGVSAGQLNNADELLLVNDYAWIEFRGRNSGIEIDAEFAITVRTRFDMNRSRGPGREQFNLCRFRGVNGFKGPNCGYAGSQTECNFTAARCLELGNIARFGGFPDLKE